MVTGIPKEDITHHEYMLAETNQKLSAIFHHIQVPMDEGLYTI